MLSKTREDGKRQILANYQSRREKALTKVPWLICD